MDSRSKALRDQREFDVPIGQRIIEANFVLDLWPAARADEEAELDGVIDQIISVEDDRYGRRHR
jgi:hypothetical protein